MSDNAEIVTAWVQSKRGLYFCAPCIMENTSVRPEAQVNQIVRPLEQARDWRYRKTTCDGCQRDRKCLSFAGS